MGVCNCVVCDSGNVKPLIDFFKETPDEVSDKSGKSEEIKSEPNTSEMSLGDLVEKSIPKLFPRPADQSLTTWLVELPVLLIPVAIGYYTSNWIVGLGLFVILYVATYKKFRAIRSKHEALIDDWEAMVNQSYLCKNCNSVFNAVTGSSQRIEEMLGLKK